MNITTSTPSPQAQAMLKALQQAVTESLERKRKLGQYAVMWQDGRPIRVEGDANNVKE
ncbi:hypothetical protein [Pseudoduganella namucuonensis]|uniref:hypothetical protein n=1 Tax=Pseudoduganella namucuonensis TaxID=1035707 RepID=UPI000B12DF90|nr:hypothetical protein [Pseudoduganella namucuonensis]